MAAICVGEYELMHKYIHSDDIILSSPKAYPRPPFGESGDTNISHPGVEFGELI